MSIFSRTFKALWPPCKENETGGIKKTRKGRTTKDERGTKVREKGGKIFCIC